MNQQKAPDGMINVQIKGRVDGGPSQTMAWFLAPSSTLCLEVAITPPGTAQITHEVATENQYENRRGL